MNGAVAPYGDHPIVPFLCGLASELHSVGWVHGASPICAAMLFDNRAQIGSLPPRRANIRVWI